MRGRSTATTLQPRLSGTSLAQLFVQCVPRRITKTALDGRFEVDFAVTRAGFEPAISTLRGWSAPPGRPGYGGPRLTIIVRLEFKIGRAPAVSGCSGLASTAAGRSGYYPRCYPNDE